MVVVDGGALRLDIMFASSWVSVALAGPIKSQPNISVIDVGQESLYTLLSYEINIQEYCFTTSYRYGIKPLAVKKREVFLGRVLVQSERPQSSSLKETNSMFNYVIPLSGVFSCICTELFMVANSQI